VLHGVDSSGGVGGGAQDEEPCGRREGSFQLGGSQQEARDAGGLHDDGSPAGQLRHGGVAGPVGGRDDHLGGLQVLRCHT